MENLNTVLLHLKKSEFDNLRYLVIPIFEADNPSLNNLEEYLENFFTFQRELRKNEISQEVINYCALFLLELIQYSFKAHMAKQNSEDIQLLYRYKALLKKLRESSVNKQTKQAIHNAYIKINQEIIAIQQDTNQSKEINDEIITENSDRTLPPTDNIPLSYSQTLPSPTPVNNNQGHGYYWFLAIFSICIIGWFVSKSNSWKAPAPVASVAQPSTAVTAMNDTTLSKNPIIISNNNQNAEQKQELVPASRAIISSTIKILNCPVYNTRGGGYVQLRKECDSKNCVSDNTTLGDTLPDYSRIIIDGNYIVQANENGKTIDFVKLANQANTWISTTRVIVEKCVDNKIAPISEPQKVDKPTSIIEEEKTITANEEASPVPSNNSSDNTVSSYTCPVYNTKGGGYVQLRQHCDSTNCITEDSTLGEKVDDYTLIKINANNTITQEGKGISNTFVEVLDKDNSWIAKSRILQDKCIKNK